MISEKLKLRVELSKTKVDSSSFMVALIPALPIPVDLTASDTVTNCAIIAANDVNGNGIYSYVHLGADEKQFIGECLEESCAPMSEWLWCNMYINTDSFKSGTVTDKGTSINR